MRENKDIIMIEVRGNEMKEFKKVMKKYLDIPSPTGFTRAAMEVAKEELDEMGVENYYTRKGALIGKIEGDSDEAIAVTAHMDTLGAMVKSITDDGRLTMHKLGGGSPAAIEGENCNIHTRSGKVYRGSILPKEVSVHIHGLKAYEKREQEDMRVRIDEMVFTKDDVKELGIQVGDIITMDTRTEFTENGFVKTRYIDNKSAVAMVMILAERFKKEKPKQTVYFIFSNYEEVGHGVTTLPEDVEELIAVDIGTVGHEQTSTEYAVSIAAKDNKSPYDYEFVSRLVNTCEKHEVPYNVDVFNHYGSDATQVIMTGGDVRFACVGPGVEATHHYERTHMKAIDATIDLLYYYLK